MKYIEGMDRDQLTLLPESIDEYLTEENSVRFLDAFVDQLSMKELGFGHTSPSPKGKGRPPYNPEDLLKLYLYGYLYQIRSSRRLEKETHRNVEVMWLLKRLRPDFKTIADFRKDNTKAIRQVCREFTILCKKLELFGRELVAIDGSFFKASASRDSVVHEKELDKLKSGLDKKIGSYLEELKKNDKKEKGARAFSESELQEKIKKLREDKEILEGIEKELKETGKTQVCKTDSDARLLKKNSKTVVGYNVQNVVDAKHNLIVEHEVTKDPNDESQLSPMALKTQSFLGVKELDVVADRGYYNTTQIKECLDQEITPWVPERSSIPKDSKIFPRAEFQYDSEKNCYHCPAGEELHYRGTFLHKKRKVMQYGRGGCFECPLFSQCTTSKKQGRRITRWEHEEVLEDMKLRLQENPEMSRRRSGIVEHPFGTLKRWLGMDHFLTRGLESVQAEFSLSVLSYNLKRALNILGVKALIAAL